MSISPRVEERNIFIKLFTAATSGKTSNNAVKIRMPMPIFLYLFGRMAHSNNGEIKPNGIISSDIIDIDWDSSVPNPPLAIMAKEEKTTARDIDSINNNILDIRVILDT
jgi:hypothetical protein